MMWHVNLTLPYLVPTAPWSISREGDRQASFPPCILNVKQFLMSLDARATSESESYERCGVFENNIFIPTGLTSSESTLLRSCGRTMFNHELEDAIKLQF
jgi:hypothetical protein